MDSFFSELKAAREAKEISLAEISEATLINIKTLEALERGDVDVAPQAYVRAFIREYASVVGLDPSDTMRKYDAWMKQRDETKQQAPPPSAEKPAEKETTEDKIDRLVPAFFKVGMAIIVLVFVDVVLWSVLEKEPTSPVKETAFRDVIRENEERAGFFDSTKTAPASPVHSETDSLTLVATTTDSVWMQVVLDDSTMKEHLLYPRTTLTWKARNEFLLLAVGNPTAISFTLNGKPISLPVKRGFVTRNVRLNRDSLRAR